MLIGPDQLHRPKRGQRKEEISKEHKGEKEGKEEARSDSKKINNSIESSQRTNLESHNVYKFGMLFTTNAFRFSFSPCK